MQKYQNIRPRQHEKVTLELKRPALYISVASATAVHSPEEEKGDTTFKTIDSGGVIHNSQTTNV